jgi:hypothetical protein
MGPSRDDADADDELDDRPLARRIDPAFAGEEVDEEPRGGGEELAAVPRGGGEDDGAAWPFNDDVPVEMSRKRVRKMVKSPLKEVLVRVLRAVSFRARPNRPMVRGKNARELPDDRDVIT